MNAIISIDCALRSDLFRLYRLYRLKMVFDILLIFYSSNLIFSDGILLKSYYLSSKL
jgi:hypothetical protein